MKYLLLLLIPLVCLPALAQQKESTVSISCYVNPQLYLQANIIAYVSDKAGNISCNGRYVTISNRSKHIFYYKTTSNWVAIQPKGKVLIAGPAAQSPSSQNPSILKLNVKYYPEASGDLDVKMRAIAQMNAESDRVKAREFGGDSGGQPVAATGKPDEEALAVVGNSKSNKNSPDSKNRGAEKPAPAPAASEKKTARATAPRVASRKAAPKAAAVGSGDRRTRQVTVATKAREVNAAGLRIDMGSGSNGIGPNFRHRFNRLNSIDAALLFFRNDRVALGAQFERSFPVRGAVGLDWYIGIGPELLFRKKNTVVALVPVTGLDYNVPGTPVDLALDWRPTFDLSPGTDVKAGRFGLSLRVTF